MTDEDERCGRPLSLKGTYCDLPHGHPGERHSVTLPLRRVTELVEKMASGTEEP